MDSSASGMHDECENVGARILIIEDDHRLADTFRRFLAAAGYGADVAYSFEEGEDLLGRAEYDAIFSDINLSARGTGMDLLLALKDSGGSTPMILITGFPGVETAAEAVRHGAFDYLCKPVEKDLLLRVARTAVRHKTLNDEKERFRNNLEAVYRSVGDAIITVDAGMIISGLNQAAEETCVFESDSIGKRLNDVASRCDGRCVSLVEETLGKGTAGDRRNMECVVCGDRKILTARVSPLFGQQGRCEGAVLVIRDETLLDDLERDLRRRRHFHNNIVGKSDGMLEVYSLIESLAGVDTTALIVGESGTGKELVADALHYAGRRANMPLVKVNCAALSENLLESELFGHIRGAFTGAVRDKKGRFERAAGGTIFLDEIGDIAPSIQQKLLRVIQEKEFERVGDSGPVKVDVRIVAATNRDLKFMVKEGKFREDLYYRLKVVEIMMPPLRERREDIRLLVNYFLENLNEELKKSVEAVSADVMKIFMEYPWPGNARELRHALEHASILCKTSVIAAGDLPRELREFNASSLLPADLTTGEASIILQTLKEAKWNKTEVARILGMSRQTLYRKLKTLGIEE